MRPVTRPLASAASRPLRRAAPAASSASLTRPLHGLVLHHAPRCRAGRAGSLRATASAFDELPAPARRAHAGPRLPPAWPTAIAWTTPSRRPTSRPTRPSRGSGPAATSAPGSTASPTTPASTSSASASARPCPPRTPSTRCPSRPGPERVVERRPRRCATPSPTLPVDQRVTVVLVDGEGFDHREAAEILGVAPGTVASRLHRARAALRRVLGEEVR